MTPLGWLDRKTSTQTNTQNVLFLQLDVYDWDSDGSHDLIGGFTTTVDELAAAQHGKEVSVIDDMNHSSSYGACFNRKSTDIFLISPWKHVVATH